MLKPILAIFGFTPVPAPKRPPSARRTPTSAPRPTPAPVSDVLSDAERRKRHQETVERLRPDPHARFARDVAILVRSFDPQSSQPSADELHLALVRLGEVGEYIRAVYAGGGRIGILPASQQGDRARTAAFREHLTHLTNSDYERWTAGLAQYDRDVAAAKRTGSPPPAPITPSATIEAGIALHAAEKVRRINEAAARRKGGTGGSEGGSGPMGGAAPATPPVPPVAPRGDDEEKPEGTEPPAGPKR
ncbi:hypothetical protein [Methylobacterium hispanicum]|uniref:hypothetical protein n=1 Tax=Methylobacterium hispanicum TaxID=270350 RepID=UPI002F3148C9